MFKSNKIFYLVALVLFSVAAFASADASNVTGLTPTNGTVSWSAGESYNIGWTHAASGFGAGGFCSWVVALVALRADGVPATYLNVNGQLADNFHGQYLGQVASRNPDRFATTESGTISLPADALPGQYKVVARCQSTTAGNYEGVSAGLVNVSNPANPSYYPLILISPLTPLTFTAGSNASGVGINLRTAEKAGGRLDVNTGAMGWVPESAPITVRMIKKLNQSVYREWVVNWVRVREGSEEVPYYLSASAGFNPEEVPAIPVGTYFFRASMEIDSQTYSIDSADLIFEAPAPTIDVSLPPPSPPVTTYHVGDTINITWLSNNVPIGSSLRIKRFNDDGSFTGRVANIITTGNTGSHPITVDSLFTVGNSYYYTVGYLNGVPSDRSGTFKIVTADTVPSASITNLRTNQTSYARGNTITIDWDTNITNRTDLILKRYKSDDTFIVQATPNNLLSHTVTVGSTFDDNTSYYYTLSYIPDSTVSARSNGFSITSAGGGPTCNNNGVCDAGETPGNCPVDCAGGDPNPGNTPGWHPPKGPPLVYIKDDGTPACDDPDTPGCWPPVNVSQTFQRKIGSLSVQGFGAWFAAFRDNILIGGSDISDLSADLKLDVEGKVGAREYCDADGQNCTSAPPNSWPGGGPGGGVSSIIAGDRITISSTGAGGTGNVTINSTGGAGTFDSSGITDCIDPTTNKIYWDGTKLVCGTDIANTSTTGGTVTSITAGTGLSAKSDGTQGGVITTLGTIAIKTKCANGDSLTTGQILKWDGRIWDCGDDLTGGGGGVSKITAGTNITISPTGGTGEVTIYGLGSVPDSLSANPTLTSIYSSYPTPGTGGFNTFSIKDGGVTNSKLNLTMELKACTSNTVNYGNEVCELGEYDFCMLTKATQNVTCAVAPTTARATSVATYNSRVYPLGTEFSGKKWWYIRVGDPNLFTNGVCAAVCFK